MELVRALRVLSQRKRWVLAAGVVSIVVALPVAYHVSLTPPALHAKGSMFAAASTGVLVDGPKTPLADTSAQVVPLTVRASLYQEFMSGGPVLAAAAHAAGIQPGQIATFGPFTALGPQLPSEQRANQLIGEGSPYRMVFSGPDPNNVAAAPILTVYAQAPTPRAAAALANGAVAGLQNYVAMRAAAEKIGPDQRVVIRQVTNAKGVVIANSPGKSMAALAFVAVWLVLCLLIVVAPRARQQWRELAWEEAYSAAQTGTLPRTPASATRAGATIAPPLRMDAVGSGASSNGAAGQIAAGAVSNGADPASSNGAAGQIAAGAVSNGADPASSNGADAPVPGPPVADAIDSAS